MNGNDKQPAAAQEAVENLNVGTIHAAMEVLGEAHPLYGQLDHAAAELAVLWVRDCRRSAPVAAAPVEITGEQLGRAMTAFDAAGGHQLSYAPLWMRKALEAASTPAAPGVDLGKLWRLSEAWTAKADNLATAPHAARALYACAKELRDDLTVMQQEDTSTPAAPGINEEKLREALSRAKLPNKERLYFFKDSEIDGLVRELCTDASPKGGSFDVDLFVRDCCEAERDDPDNPHTICIDVGALTMIAQRCAEQANTNGRSETLALLKAHESALRAQVVFSDDRYDDEVKDRCAADVAHTRNALLAAMQATSAEVGS